MESRSKIFYMEEKKNLQESGRSKSPGKNLREPRNAKLTLPQSAQHVMLNILTYGKRIFLGIWLYSVTYFVIYIFLLKY